MPLNLLTGFLAMDGADERESKWLSVHSNVIVDDGDNFIARC